jgi:hypothetical protein
MLYGAGGTWTECVLPGGVTQRGGCLPSPYVCSLVQVVPGRTVRSLVGDLERLFCTLSLCMLNCAGGTWAECELPGGGSGEAVLYSLLMYALLCRWYLGGVCAPWWGIWKGCFLARDRTSPLSALAQSPVSGTLCIGFNKSLLSFESYVGGQGPMRLNAKIYIIS